MTLATSRRLRPCCLLLLLFPLLMASTPPLGPISRTLVQALGTPERLAFARLPPEFVVDQCSPLWVEVHDSEGNALTPVEQLKALLGSTLSVGAFYDSNSCSNPVGDTLITPDVPSRQVWFKATGTGSVTLSATSPQSALGAAQSRMLLVVATPTTPPGPATRFDLVGLPGAPIAGTAYKFQVIPVDANGAPTSYSGKVQFSTDVLRAELPSDFEGSLEQREFTVIFFSADPAQKYLKVTDIHSGQGLTGKAFIVVRHGAFKTVMLSSTAPSPVPACKEVTLDLAALDDWGNLVSDVPITGVTLCKSSGSSATLVSSTLGAWLSSGSCVTGTLTGSAQVVWKNQVEEEVEFSVSNVNTKGPVTILWKAGLPSPVTSALTFLESTEPTPSLRSYGGQLTLQLALRDLCGNPVSLPEGKNLSFAADPLLFLDPPVQKGDGQWSLPVYLGECPADPSTPLAVWPLLNNEPLFKDGKRVQRLVLPQCRSPVVRLTLLTPAKSLVAEPGGLVEFEVQVENDDDLPRTDGVLKLTPVGLAVLEASINSESLPTHDQGFSLPELSKGSPLTVKVKAQATAPFEQPVNTKVSCTNQGGAPLSEELSMDFLLGDDWVDVGCGCGSGGPSGQLVPWLVLLLAASRPQARWRRLRRRERIDRQES